MGCDIHAAIEYKDATGWHALIVPDKWAGKGEGEDATTVRFDIDRDYDLFAILANVRNGVGFAGCDLGDGFNFIGELRGLPEDISPEARQQACTGDHSDTWVSLPELLAFDWTQVSRHRGVVSAVEFEQWDRRKQWEPAPQSFSGGVMGGNTRKVSNEEMRAEIQAVIGHKRGKKYEQALETLRESNLYTRIEWDETYSYSARQLFEKILPHMLKLAAIHGQQNVRLVMNFDS